MTGVAAVGRVGEGAGVQLYSHWWHAAIVRCMGTAVPLFPRCVRGEHVVRVIYCTTAHAVQVSL